MLLTDSLHASAFESVVTSEAPGNPAVRVVARLCPDCQLPEVL